MPDKWFVKDNYFLCCREVLRPQQMLALGTATRYQEHLRLRLAETTRNFNNQVKSEFFFNVNAVVPRYALVI